MSLLVTAFGRFDGGPNCSETLLDALQAEDLAQIWGAPVAFLRLDVDTATVEAALSGALVVHRPSHVLLMGQAAGRAAVCFERIARNRRDFRAPDSAGRTGALGPVRPEGPETRAATWPDLDGAAAALHAAGVPARVSDDAGTHLCNQTLYLALEAGECAAPPFVATFLHLPLLPEQVAAGLPAAQARGCVPLPLGAMARAVRLFLRHTRALDDLKVTP